MIMTVPRLDSGIGDHKFAQTPSLGKSGLVMIWKTTQDLSYIDSRAPGWASKSRGRKGTCQLAGLVSHRARCTARQRTLNRKRASPGVTFREPGAPCLEAQLGSRLFWQV